MTQVSKEEKKPVMVEVTEYPCGCVVCKDQIIRRCYKHENYGKPPEVKEN